MRVLTRNAADNDGANFQELLDIVRGSAAAPVLGSIQADAPRGGFVDAWRAKLHGAGVTVVDATRGVDSAMCVKTPAELVRASSPLPAVCGACASSSCCWR